MIETWEIVGPSGFSELRLGEERSVVRRILGDHRAFRRTPDAPLTDQFVSSGVMVTYDSGGHALLIEVAPPANPTIKGVGLMGRPVVAVLDELAAHGIHAIADDAGAVIPTLCVGLFAPDGVVEGVSVGDA